MFAQLPGFKSRKSLSLASNPSIRTSVPRLSAVKVRPSVILWRVQWGTHLLLLLFLCWGFWPSLSELWQGLLVVILASLILGTHLYYLWRLHRQSSGVLALDSNGWCWQDSSGYKKLALSGAVTVWPQLIVLPFTVCCERRRKTLVLVSDSANSEDLRRLRVWLRTSLDSNQISDAR